VSPRPPTDVSASERDATAAGDAIAPTHTCEDEPGTFVLEPTSLAYGPDAVGRHEGRVVFVPGAAPGDRVRVRVVEQHGNYARATMLHRCTAGPAHREPPCPWVGACGGCPWQHVDYATQVAAKERNVLESLKRIAGVIPRRPLPILAAPSEWAYRHRIRLHTDARRALGYRRPRSHDLVEIGHCVIAEPELSAVLPALRALLPSLATAIDDVEIASNGRGAVVIDLSARGRFAERDGATLQAWLHATSRVAGLGLRGRDWTRRFGDTTLTVHASPDSPPTTQRLGSFTQVSPAGNRLLVRTVVDLVDPGATVLDLFCGAGNLSLPIARVAASVVGVDQDEGGVADAAASARAAGLGTVRFETAAADRFLRRRGLAGAALVILDPPRTGAAQVVAQLARLEPPRILYVSCDPATLARDVRALAGAGYTVDRVQPIDLFPQTEHVETVLEAVLTAR
jgi:23S rRNA (uracil1939-C5)-methyltransferase